MNYEFYETPHTFSNYLFSEVDVRGRVFEPCVGSGAILQARWPPGIEWVTNDLDTRWPADYHSDARYSQLFHGVRPIDWVVSNPPFSSAIQIISCALDVARVGVAMHLRASIHEVLKTGIRRTWMAQHLPTGILWLPRFAYQRSRVSGDWQTDNVGACWVIWLKDRSLAQFIRYAPEWVIDALAEETPAYRQRMDKIMLERSVV